jgi:hypothetical protein
MTIRHGNVTHVQSKRQFLERTDFSELDLIRGEFDEDRLIEEYNELHAGEDYFDGPIDSLEEMHEDDIDEYLSNVSLNRPIQTLLEEDNREWVHLYDGTVHTIVELYPEDWK